MTAGSLYLPEPASRDDRLAARRAVDCLSFGAAPTFAFMAALTAVLGGGVHEMSCSAGSHTSALSGMLPMYVLMSAFHFTPWLKLISRRRSGARAADLTHGAACRGRSRNNSVASTVLDRPRAAGEV
jgi:hypothetical protein